LLPLSRDFIKNVDVRTELENFAWDNANWTDTKLIAASPFRWDRKPSFFCNYDKDSEYYGVWGDSGAEDDNWRSGGFIKLLSFLRGETYEETAEYLMLTYSNVFNDDMTLPPLTLPLKARRTPLNESKLIPYRFRHEYLLDRQISEPVQSVLGVGYDRERKAITIPWRLPDGRLANIKYRNIHSKIFWYKKGGWPIRKLVYNIDRIYKKRLTSAVLCEAEIDAMSFMTAGIPAIAVGHGGISKEQAELIRKSTLNEVYVCVDNDVVGNTLRQNIHKKLNGYKVLRDIILPRGYKDANEALVAGIDLKLLVEESRKLTLDNRTLVCIQ
jgi:5S rRNA maturation endonuclease (ribonuclease M5)